MITKRDLIIFLITSIFLVLICLGINFNSNTILSNGGKMPVSEKILGYFFVSGDHFTYKLPNDINNYFWTDRLKLPFYSSLGVFSWGDVLLFVGFICYAIMVVYMLLSYTYWYFKNKKKPRISDY